MTSRFAVAAEVLGLLAWAEQRGEGAMTSQALARSVHTHPVVIRRIVADLQRAGLVHSRRGTGGGTSLARPAEQITLRDVYEAVAIEEALLPCAPGGEQSACPVGKRLHGWLATVIDQAEEALLCRLAEQTVADMRDQGCGC